MAFQLFASLGALFSAFRTGKIGYRTAQTAIRNNKKLSRNERNAAIEKLIRENQKWYEKAFTSKQRQWKAGAEERFLKGDPPKTPESMRPRTHKKRGGLVTANNNKKQIKGPYS